MVSKLYLPPYFVSLLICFSKNYASNSWGGSERSPEMWIDHYRNFYKVMQPMTNYKLLNCFKKCKLHRYRLGMNNTINNDDNEFPDNDKYVNSYTENKVSGCNYVN